MNTAKEISNYIVSYFSTIATNSIEGDLTNLKLQKLLYYCQINSLKKYKTPLFDDVIEAWDYGPVISSVYKQYKPFGRGILDTETPNLLLEPYNIQLIVDEIIEDKGRYTGITLMHMTHEDNAWKIARNSKEKIISIDLMMQDIA